MLPGGSHNSGGIFGSIRRFLISGNEFLASKLDLIGVELQEEKRRILELLALTAAALSFGLLGLTVLTLAVVSYFWETYRTEALFGVGIVYLLLAGMFCFWVQRKATLSSRIFETTVEELKKDVDWVKSRLH